MDGSSVSTPPKLPRAAVLGVALILIAPALWLGLPPAATDGHVLAGPNHPGVTAGGTSTNFPSFANFGSETYAAYDAAANGSMLVDFPAPGTGSLGGILELSGPGLKDLYQVNVGCNPFGLADDPATAQVLTLCQAQNGSWEIILISVTTHQPTGIIPLPPSEWYDPGIVYDQRNGVVYCLQEPTNVSRPTWVLGVNAGNGRVVSNFSIPTDEHWFPSTIVLGSTPGTLFRVDRQAGKIELVNASTGAVVRTSSPGFGDNDSIWSDPETGRIYVISAYPPASAPVQVLSATNLSWIGTYPLDGAYGVTDDVTHGDTYFATYNQVQVARTSDLALVGTIAVPGVAVAYDPASDQLAGGTDGGGGVFTTMLSRSTIASEGFSSVPLVGTNLTAAFAGASLLVGVLLVAVNRRALSRVLQQRRAERERRFTEWLANPGDSIWVGESPGNQPKK